MTEFTVTWPMFPWMSMDSAVFIKLFFQVCHFFQSRKYLGT